MISIIIPAYYEPYLKKTIESIFAKSASDDLEVIVVLDGWKPRELLDKRIKQIVFKKNLGMREAINQGIEKARGKFIMKLDAHCMLCSNFDRLFLKSYRQNWLVIPRRYYLNSKIWKIGNNTFDYHYLSSPANKGKFGNSMSVFPYSPDKQSSPLDDTMMFQGSCWFAKKDDFLEKVGKLNTKKFGKIGGEQIEIGLNYWLKGGQVKINKDIWYGHLQKTKSFYLDEVNNKSGYNLKRNKEAICGRERLTKYWLNDENKHTIYSFKWLINKFWPVPGWDADWIEKFADIKYTCL